ncbi:MAG: SpoVG family protein [Candidatus Roizmanbacteria bacterium]|nr:SpoVG family protein [Candidatus Roizmanbacteria bacterium]
MKDRITELQIVPVKPSNGLVGFASLVFDGCLYLGSIGIYTRPEGGYRLTYPTRKTTNSSFNVFHPINKDVAQQIERAVIKKFEDVTKMYVGHNQINTG